MTKERLYEIITAFIISGMIVFAYRYHTSDKAKEEREALAEDLHNQIFEKFGEPGLQVFEIIAFIMIIIAISAAIYHFVLLFKNL